MTTALIECSLCHAEMTGLRGFSVCLYCDFTKCLFCEHDAPGRYLFGEECNSCGKKHPKSK